MKRSRALLSACAISLFMLSGCQPDPVTESQIEADFPLTQATIYINKNIQHNLPVTEFEISSRQAEDKSELVYCTYEATDGEYAASGEYALSYEYIEGQWCCVSSWSSVDPTITVISDNPPEEMMDAISEWEEHFSSSETLTQTKEFEKVSDTQYQATYSVSEEYEYWKSGTNYVIQGSLEPWFSDSTDCFRWSVQEGVADSYEIWDIVGEYEYDGSTWYTYLNIDSFDPETLQAHVVSGEFRYYAQFSGDEDSVYTLSDEILQFTYKEPQIGVPRYLSYSEYPFTTEVYANSFQVSERPMKKLS
ncbi:MAG: hypothetical protein IKY34_03285 [Ruminiclostridium sp.]|nr:hypothetical protein [Ruminiclostridium sp.]